jgi:hypothetical protein
MGLFRQISSFRLAKKLDRASGVVAARSRTAVAERVGGSADSMGRSETSGYVRALAAAIVHREVNTVLATEGQLPAWCRRELVARATDLVVAQVSQELMAAVPVVSPHRQAG